MEFIRLLSGALVSLSLFSSKSEVAFPKTKKVEDFYYRPREQAETLEYMYKLEIIRRIPSLNRRRKDTFSESGDLSHLEDDPSIETFVARCDIREEKDLPFCYRYFENSKDFCMFRWENKKLNKLMVFRFKKSEKNENVVFHKMKDLW